ncbi:hypothetical protein OAC51_09310 [Flavobacteriaceae bacterium]|nr:hypothetical protein [Flavobacteriaceae bacterium]
MKAFKTTFIFFFLLNWSNGFTQNYGNEPMKINNYEVKTYGHNKELSDDITPYQEALGIDGLTFNQYPPDDPQTDDPENWIRMGEIGSSDRFFMIVNEGEWVSSFSNYNQNFQVSIGDRVFTIGDAKEETLAKLDLGYKFYKDNQNVARFFYGEGFFYIGFKDDKIHRFRFGNTSY